MGVQKNRPFAKINLKRKSAFHAHPINGPFYLHNPIFYKVSNSKKIAARAGRGPKNPPFPKILTLSINLYLSIKNKKNKKKKEKDKRIKNKGLQYPGKPRTATPVTASPLNPVAVRRAQPHCTFAPRAAAQNEKAIFSAVFFA
ncbi:MAG: hypothetical protein VSS75_031015 [Candidatus Parabeggiatoa sp.]|nr:hypothetical protein [Candidatus Parabeggiatoa sp.]